MPAAFYTGNRKNDKNSTNIKAYFEHVMGISEEEEEQGRGTKQQNVRLKDKA